MSTYYTRAIRLLRNIGVIPSDLHEGMVDSRWPLLAKKVEEVEEALVEAEEHGKRLERLNRRRER